MSTACHGADYGLQRAVFEDGLDDPPSTGGSARNMRGQLDLFRD